MTTNSQKTAGQIVAEALKAGKQLEGNEELEAAMKRQMPGLSSFKITSSTGFKDRAQDE